MPRSKWKGPYLDDSLFRKVKKYVSQKKKNHFPRISLYSRQSMIFPSFVGFQIKLYNGKQFVPFIISEEMIGHKLGEFVPTREKTKKK